jgi:hypothetical protein
MATTPTDEVVDGTPRVRQQTRQKMEGVEQDAMWKNGMFGLDDLPETKSNRFDGRYGDSRSQNAARQRVWEYKQRHPKCNPTQLQQLADAWWFQGKPPYVLQGYIDSLDYRNRARAATAAATSMPPPPPSSTSAATSMPAPPHPPMAWYVRTNELSSSTSIVTAPMYITAINYVPLAAAASSSATSAMSSSLMQTKTITTTTIVSMETASAAPSPMETLPSSAMSSSSIVMPMETESATPLSPMQTALPSSVMSSSSMQTSSSATTATTPAPVYKLQPVKKRDRPLQIQGAAVSRPEPEESDRRVHGRPRRIQGLVRRCVRVYSIH